MFKKRYHPIDDKRKEAEKELHAYVAQQVQPGFGALTLREEYNGEPFQNLYAYAAQYGLSSVTAPRARPRYDERGRKMSTSHQPRMMRIRWIIPGVLQVAIGVLFSFALILSPNKPDTTAEWIAAVALFVVPFLLSIWIFSVTRYYTRAIAYDNRHGAAIHHLAHMQKHQVFNPQPPGPAGPTGSFPYRNTYGYNQ